MVQGKHRELWKETEFTKLPELVYQLCKTDEIDNKMIGSLYTKVFGNHDATDVMNLEGVSLDIHTESDAEIEQRNDDDIDSISNLKPWITPFKSS
jgi:hypothetical protein